MTQKNTVALASFPVVAGMLPLAAGYIESYGKADPNVASAWKFWSNAFDPTASDDDIVKALLATEARVYGFSCYVWNMGRVRRILGRLLDARPDAQYVLGGPQVINQAKRYLPPDRENVYVCNGEGEKTFNGFLLESLESHPEFAKVKGLSFVRDGAILTTEPQERIKNLDEIPSPFLEGVFEKDRYSWFMLETNRGCPFSCTYCFWGAATGAKITKFGEERILEELDWIATYPALTLHLIDSNVGMLPRDVTFAQRIGELKEETGFPMEVIFSASKNTPSRVAEVATIFADAGVTVSQPISLQTMSQETLKNVRRDNIRPDAYIELQRILNERGLSSYIELIWPLPGETVESFRAGIGELCRLGADSFTIYPMLLINNVEINLQREEFGLVTMKDADPNSEAEVVVGTKLVDDRAYGDGIRFAMAVSALYSGRGLWSLGRYLDRKGLCSYADLIKGFVDWSSQHPDNSFSRFVAYILNGHQHKFSSIGGTLHVSHFAARHDFDALLGGYLNSFEWFDEEARLHLELDLVNRPYVYLSPAQRPAYDFKLLRIDRVGEYSLHLTVPEVALPIIREHYRSEGPLDSGRLSVNYRNEQGPYMPRRGDTANFMYCHGKLEKMATVLPTWSNA